MICPDCKTRMNVIKTRVIDHQSVRRWRTCPSCGHKANGIETRARPNIVGTSAATRRRIEDIISGMGRDE